MKARRTAQVELYVVAELSKMKGREMKRMPAYLFVLVGCFTLTSAVFADPEAAPSTSPAPLELTLTVPQSAGSDLTNVNFHFDVTITNVSNEPVRIWKRWCSWGAYDIRFFVDADDGTPFHPSREVGLYLSGSWFMNYADPLTLGPGEQIVRSYYVYVPRPQQNARPSDPLSADVWRPDPRWDVPMRSHRVKMYAVLTVSSYLAAGVDVWTGSVASPTVDFDLSSRSTGGCFDNVSIEGSPFYAPPGADPYGWMHGPDAPGAPDNIIGKPL